MGWRFARNIMVSSMTALGLTACTGGGGSDCPLQECGTFENHEYSVYRPANATDNAPWLVLLHGSGVPMGHTAYQWSATEFADQNGYIVVVPHAVQDSWDLDLDGDADVIVRLLHSLRTNYGTPRAVFVAGWSSGAAQSQVLACRHGDSISGVISLAGELIGSYAAGCQPTRPPGVALIHGNLDEVVPIEGGVMGMLSMQANHDLWRTRNGCTGEDTVGVPFNLEVNLRSTTTTSTGCQAPVQSTLTRSGRHAPNFNAAELHPFMLDFFERTLAARGE